MPQSDRAAKHVQEGGEAFESGELIKAKLDHAIRYIATKSTHATLHGRLSSDEQHAVRLLKSRQRMIDREWHAVFGNGKMKINAVAELKLSKPDDGTLFRLGEKWHSRGRLDCKACATTMLEDLPIPVPVSRICPKCKDGVEHAYDVQELKPLPEGIVLGDGDVVTTVPEGGNKPMKVVVTRYFHCDGCNSRDQVVL